MTALHILAGAAAVLAIQGVGLALIALVRKDADAKEVAHCWVGVTFWFIWITPWLISRHRHLSKTSAAATDERTCL